jgi:hypothetical protein
LDPYKLLATTTYSTVAISHTLQFTKSFQFSASTNVLQWLISTANVPIPLSSYGLLSGSVLCYWRRLYNWTELNNCCPIELHNYNFSAWTARKHLLSFTVASTILMTLQLVFLASTCTQTTVCLHVSQSVVHTPQPDGILHPHNLHQAVVHSEHSM